MAYDCKTTLEYSTLDELLLLCKLNGVTAQTTKRKKLIIALNCHLKRTFPDLDDYAIRCYEWPLVSALDAAAHKSASAAKSNLSHDPSACFENRMNSDNEIMHERAGIHHATINNDTSKNIAKMGIFGMASVELNVTRLDHELSRLHPGVTVDRRLKDNSWVASGLFDDLVKFRQDLAAHLTALTTIPALPTSLNSANDSLRYVLHIPRVCTVQVYKANLCTEQVDAVVNAANSDLKHGTGIAGALVQHIGPKLQEYCDKTVLQYGVVSVGHARYSPSFDGIPARYVIHAVGPRFDSDCQSNQGKAEELLLAAYSSALHEARKLKIRSIAFPGLSTGVFGVPVEISAKAAVRAVVAFVNEGQPVNLSDIRFVDIGDRVVTEFIARFKAWRERFPAEAREMSDTTALQKEYSASRLAGSGDSSKNVDSGRFEDSGKPAPDRARPSESAASHGDDDKCVICLESLHDAKHRSVLDKCGHTFHTGCLETAFKRKKECPTCRTIYGVIIGNQPRDGIMTYKRASGKIAGFNSPNHIVVYYDFPNGIQSSDHPNPGAPYTGTRRTAYLPDTREGNLVLKLLKMAFDRRLIFTVGDSNTTGTQNTVVWNNIHHKTHLSNSEYGYPDDKYLDRVMEELKAVGVTPESLN